MKRKSSVGTRTPVKVREVFPHEAHEFTVWLADNLGTLSSALNLELSLIKREATADGIRADIVCEDSSGNRVIIENQLEPSDDDHFTRIIQYMGKFGANTAVWITPNSTQRHLETVSVLNSQCKPGIGYYLVEVSAFRIDDSRPFPEFKVLISPEGQMGVDAELIESDLEVDKSTEIESLGVVNHPLWCFYPRRDEKTYQLFIQKKYLGLGFGDELGDLAKLKPTPDAFKAQWLTKRPGSSEAQTRVFYTMFYRFVHRVKIGDLVVYAPTWRERKLYIGKITGAYQYDRGRIFPFYSHRRSVEWISEFSRDSFSTEALKGIRVTLAIFQVQNEVFLEELNKKLR